jgi:hypothetical protein
MRSPMTSPSDNRTPRPGERSLRERAIALVKSETLQAAVVLLLELWMFFGTPLSRYSEVYYSAADLTQAFSLTRIEPGHQPGNQLQSDAATQMKPWTLFNREELAAGRMGLWNPWNGAGCPHFANFQSAVFSPFSLPSYLLGMKAALLVSAALKLFALGFFTYLFLRRIRVAHLAALVGATTFMFAGHNVLLLYFPHVGSMVALPAGLWCVEIAFQRVEAAFADGTRARLVAPLAGLTLALLAGLLAGNPEPFYFAALLVAAYSGARLGFLWFDHARTRAARIVVAQLAGKLAFSAALAAGLGMFQVLPFLEFLQNSRVIEQRSFRQTPLNWADWPLMMFPNALGNPGSPYKISESVPFPNFELVMMAYTGALATMCAIVAVLFARRDRRVAFFAVAGLVWVFYAYDLFGAYDLLEHIPTLDMAPMNRSQGVWNFIVACSAALCIDHAARREGAREWFTAFGIVALGAAALAACLLGIDVLITKYSTTDSPNHKLFLQYVPEHIRWMSWSFAGGTALLALLLLSRQRAVRGLAILAIGCGIFFQSGHLFRNYNPVTENRFFFPVTPAIATLQEKVGTARLAILGEDSIPPDSNIAYHLQLLSSYDGMWVKYFDFLYRDQFGDSNNWRPMLKGTKRGLKIFGVQYVLAKWDWNFVDNGLAEFGKGGHQQPIRQEILPERDVVQTFRGRAPALQTVMVYLSTFPHTRPCELKFKLEDLDGGKVVCERTLASAEVQSSVYSKRHVTWPTEYRLNPQGRPVVFHFEPQLDSLDRHYRITLSCPEGRGADTICAWSMPLNGYGEGEAFYGKRKLPGELLFDWSYDGDSKFERVAEFEDYVLYRYRDALPKYSIVDRAVLSKSDTETLELMRAPSFDPKKLVALNTDDPALQSSELNFGLVDNSKRRLVKFDDADYCYLVAEDGKTLAHIDDEMTFLANNFSWDHLEKVPGSERSKYTIIPDTDVDAKLRTGLRLVTPLPKGAHEVEVLDESPTNIHLRVQRNLPGYVLVSQAWFPGWKARINGNVAPVYRANYAFSAIPVQPGDWQIEFSYEPDSLKKGVWIGIASLVLGLAAIGYGWKRALVA